MLNFALSVIGPVVLLIAFGYALYKTGLMTDDFVERASRLIFNFALPALLFTTIAKSDISTISDKNMLVIGVLGTLGICLVLMLIAPYIVTKRADRGVVIQGAFRSNMGIIGLAYCANAYGQEGLALASIYLGALTITYNVISVIILNFYLDSKTSYLRMIKGVVTNPIILAIVSALLVSNFQLNLPSILINSAGYFAQLTLPLALLCTGAALRFSSLRADGKAAAISILVKCFIYPFVIVAFALGFGIDGMALGVVYLMSIAPTAAASYVMVRKIGGNYTLAAHIIAISTLVSVPITIAGYSVVMHYM
ncbi:AEC family transporter [Glaciecola sp. MH2013]|uniref:AEC family transporter n=1 Tax=Glaciecola sp. MH2013 TaxID=2785524 RepID=UPI00189DAF9D|nr:AEC family transporter [Glaciecola sp. MH2013]